MLFYLPFTSTTSEVEKIVGILLGQICEFAKPKLAAKFD